MKIRRLVLILILLMASFMVFATDDIVTTEPVETTESAESTEPSEPSEPSEPLETQEEDSLLLAGEPIIYGEERFIERIKEKTGGQREPVGVVLSGGSARAFAHIGVLEYLEEQGIVPDFIVGNSMGSIIALLYSAGLSPAQIVQVITSTDIGNLFDFTLPINTGLLNVDKFKSCLAAYLGEDLRLEDLAIPVIVVCEDMVTKRQVLLAEGDFYEVLAASFALPVYFGSVQYGEHVLIDGGIANLVPLSLAYKYSDNILVSTTFYAGKDLNLKNPLTGLNVSIDIGKRRQGVAELLSHPDAVWVRCNVEDFSFMDFASCSLIAQHGYDSCLEKTEEIASLVSLYNADESSVIINAQFKEKLVAKRAEFEIQIPRTKRNYEIFNRTSNNGTSSMFGLELSSHGSNGYFLRDDLLFGLSYTFSYGDLDLNIGLGGSSKLQSFGYDSYTGTLKPYATTLPTLNLLLDWYIGNHFKFNFDATLYYKFDFDEGFQFDYSSLLSQSFQYRSGAFNIGALGGDFKFVLRETLEVTFRNSNVIGTFWDCTMPLTTLMGQFSYSSSVFSASLDAGLQTLGWPNSGKGRIFGATSFSLGVSAWKLPVELDLKLTSRFAFDRKGDVPIFPSDGYFLVDEKLKAQGSSYAESVNASNEQQYVSVASVAVDWTFYSKKIGLAELLLLSNNKLGAFVNLLWYNGLEPTAQVGAKLSTEVGFLGLKSAPLTVSVFYDFGINRVLWQVKLETSI